MCKMAQVIMKEKLRFSMFLTYYSFVKRAQAESEKELTAAEESAIAATAGKKECIEIVNNCPSNRCHSLTHWFD